MIMGIAMVAMLAFGGTFAYFTATATSVAITVKTGRVKITNNTGASISINENVDVVPGEWLYGGESTWHTIELTSDSTAATYVFAKFDVTVGGEKATVNGTSENVLLETVDTVSQLTAANVSWQKVEVSGETGVYCLKVAATTDPTALDIDFQFKVKFNEKVQSNYDQVAGKETNNTSLESIMHQDVELTISFAAIQQFGYSDSDLAAAYADAIKTVTTSSGAAVRP